MNDFQPQDRVTGHFDNASNVYYDWYAQQTPDGHSFRIRKQRCMELLRDLPSGAHVTDAGCGPATMIGELLARGFEVTGTDIAPGMIEECRKRFASNPHATFSVAPAERLPFSDGSQDAVTAMGLLEYLNNEDAVLKEFHRVLKPGGIVLLTYPYYWSPTRVWDRLTHALAWPLLATGIIKRRDASGVKHREYLLNPTLSNIRAAGYEVTDVVFYNFKLGFRPLDTLVPKFIVRIAETLERFCRTPILRSIGTGFIVRAKKS